MPTMTGQMVTAPSVALSVQSGSGPDGEPAGFTIALNQALASQNAAAAGLPQEPGSPLIPPALTVPAVPADPAGQPPAEAGIEPAPEPVPLAEPPEITEPAGTARQPARKKSERVLPADASPQEELAATQSPFWLLPGYRGLNWQPIRPRSRGSQMSGRPCHTRSSLPCLYRPSPDPGSSRRRSSQSLCIQQRFLIRRKYHPPRICLPGAAIQPDQPAPGRRSGRSGADASLADPACIDSPGTQLGSPGGFDSSEAEDQPEDAHYPAASRFIWQTSDPSGAFRTGTHDTSDYGQCPDIGTAGQSCPTFAGSAGRQRICLPAD